MFVGMAVLEAQNKMKHSVSLLLVVSVLRQYFDLVTASLKSNFQWKESENNEMFHSISGVSIHHSSLCISKLIPLVPKSNPSHIPVTNSFSFGSVLHTALKYTLCSLFSLELVIY